MKDSDIFVIHREPDPSEGTAYSKRPKAIPTDRPSSYEMPFRTPEPMVYFTSTGKFQVRMSYKHSDGRWMLKQQTVDTMQKAKRLRKWWQKVGRVHAESR